MGYDHQIAPASKRIFIGSYIFPCARAAMFMRCCARRSHTRAGASLGDPRRWVGGCWALARAMQQQQRLLVPADAFRRWMSDVLVARGFGDEEARETASFAAQAAEYEVETHGARKIFSLLDHEFARSGSCVPQAQHEVLLSTPGMEVWDGKKKLGPAISKMAQARSVEMATVSGMGVVRPYSAQNQCLCYLFSDLPAKS